MPPVIHRPSPQVYVDRACSVISDAVGLLRDPGVHQGTALEELVIGAPRWGEIDRFFRGAPHFRIEVDLPQILRQIDGQHGISAQEGRILATKFADYQWSKTPEVWESYLRSRQASSYLVRNASQGFDCFNTVTALYESLDGLMKRPEVQHISAISAVRVHLKTLEQLKERYNDLPAELTLWEELTTLFNPRSHAAVREADRRSVLKGIQTTVEGLGSTLQQDLIAFGKEYRAWYLQWQPDMTPYVMVKAELGEVSELLAKYVAQATGLVAEGDRSSFEEICRSLGSKTRSSPEIQWFSRAEIRVARALKHLETAERRSRDMLKDLNEDRGQKSSF